MTTQQLIDEYLKRYPIPGRAEERELIMLAKQGDGRAREHLICANYRLVLVGIKKYSNSTVSFDDAFQQGIMGLCEALGRFDLSYNNRYMAYAKLWVRHFISLFALCQNGTVYFPPDFLSVLREIEKNLVRKNQFSLETLRNQLKSRYGKNGIGRDLDHVLTLFFSKEVSLYEPVEVDRARTYLDVCRDPRFDELNQYEITLRKERCALLHKALRSKKLTRLERRVLYCRFFKGLGLRETSEELVKRRLRARLVTRQMIGFIERRALHKLKKVVLRYFRFPSGKKIIHMPLRS